ncbi:HemK2/MTQ2 family protein methyltransferase [Natronorarus salvus]|uniref:HemK2/MTQ2 family protein methyltransferase n=1 Tax=Natronorarus salvus TaxID=3117733 RepID=UPI002F269998
MTGRDLAERRGMETEVYEPAEDSHLLAETAAGRIGSDDRVLDCGTGSGYVGTHVAAVSGARVVASDVNPHACRRARGEDLEAVRGDLLGPFSDESFDAVLFNPPYLPTDPENEWDDWMERALSGGESGRAVIEPFLRAVGRVLAPGGRAFVLVSSLTGYEAVLDLAREAGLAAESLRDESYPFETLTVLSLSRRSRTAHD